MRCLHRTALAAFALAALAAPVLPQSCPTTPPARCADAGHQQQALGVPSIAVADDGHFTDLAHEFMAGCSEGEAKPRLANGPPGDWCRAHIQLNLQDQHLYDRDVGQQGGRDDQSPNGIDTPPLLLFLAAHGTPMSLETTAQPVALSDFLVGNGKLRYLWLCSCNLMAHGKSTLGGYAQDYYQPSSFAGGVDVNGRNRNVYSRWSTVLAPALRLACGGSSKICANHDELTDRVWDDYNNKGYQVADSFIDGLLGSDSGVAMCMTRWGEEDIQRSPLYDDRFDAAANPKAARPQERDYLYLLYPELLPIEQEKETAPPASAHGKYPVYRLAKNFGVAQCPERAKVEQIAGSECAAEAPAGEEPALRLDKRTGATYLPGAALGPPIPLAQAPSADALVKAATQRAQQLDWLDSPYSVEGYRFVIERAKLGGDGTDYQRYQKSAVVIFRRQIRVEHGPLDVELVPVLGPGGEASFLLNNDLSMVRATRVWRSIDPQSGAKAEANVDVERLPVRSVDAALSALQNRSDAKPRFDAYQRQPVRTVWGYKEEAGNCQQRMVRLVYRFTFLPKDQATLRELPPLTLEIPAQVLAGEENGPPDNPCY